MTTATTNPQLILTPAEQNIATVLRDTCNWIISQPQQHITIQASPTPIEVINQHTYTQINTIGHGTLTARIAGGWVRDKLLHRDSDDLDISLSSTTGFTFAHFLAAYLASPQFASSDLAARIASSSSSTTATTSSIAKIAANPEQSKNLETATAKVFGLSLDFVNLRKEVYEGDTRIPIMSFGTAKEDAERRDITINSLFYNVHTQQVEDLTGMGLNDLARGLIRTPLPPHITFLDDPLRVLRCIRFAARFNYVVHPDIIACLSDKAPSQFYTPDKRVFGSLEDEEEGRGVYDEEEVRKARVEFKDVHLRSKVSRERFGIEVDKMMRGPDPLRAISLITALDLYSVIFHPPHSPLFPHLLPFDLDPASPALQPSPTSTQIASQIREANVDRHKRRPGPNVLGYQAGSRLKHVWDLAAGKKEEEDARMQEGGGGEIPSAKPTDVYDDSAALAYALQHQQRPSSSQWTGLLPQELINVMLDPEQRARLFMAAALLPMERIGVLEAVGGGPSGGGKKGVKLVWAGESVLTHGLKLGNRQAKIPVSALFRARALIETVLSRKKDFMNAKADAGAAKKLGLPGGIWPEVEVEAGEGEGRMLAKFGLLLRQPSLTSSANNISLAAALLFALASRLAHNALKSEGEEKEEEEEDIVREYVWLWEQCTQGGLLERAEEKPVLDGNQIKTTLAFQPGPLTPRIQTAILAWQYAQLPRPGPQQPGECEKWLKETWEKGGVVPLEGRKLGGGGGAGGKKKERAPPGVGGDGGSRKRQKSEEGA
ncbi:hypothetical protein CF327_g3178 [Tilletia walkeri]|nr:hypothetical protein CF327_g3178 [Tilletia walkeri]